MLSVAVVRGYGSGVEHIGGTPVGLAAQLREAVVSLGPAGSVEWANDAALALLRLRRDELVGSDALDRVHPDEVARALDGIVFSASHPDRTAVVPFRIRRGDDTWADVELMSSVVSAEDGEHLVLVLRDAAPRRSVARALASVAAGAPLEETAHWLAGVIEARWPGTIAAVLIDDRRGRRLLAADNWDGDLCGAVLDPRSEAVWRGAVASGDVVVTTGDDIPPAARGRAEALGYSAVGVAPVVDPGGGSAALVAWFDLPAAADMEFAHASLELRELLGLALERRHHLSRLDHAVRHDSLTGLLNRSGFLELALGVGDEIGVVSSGDRSATDDTRAALLYVDLDGFKPVNDRYGHGVGDAVLRVVAGRLSALAGEWAAARIGGDEFVLLGRGAAALDDEATSLAEAIVAALTEPIEVASSDGDLVGVRIGASVGVAVTGADCDVRGLLELADGAMYSVKAAGGGGWSAHVPR